MVLCREINTHNIFWAPVGPNILQISYFSSSLQLWGLWAAILDETRWLLFKDFVFSYTKPWTCEPNFVPVAYPGPLRHHEFSKFNVFYQNVRFKGLEIPSKMRVLEFCSKILFLHTQCPGPVKQDLDKLHIQCPQGPKYIWNMTFFTKIST